MEVRLDSEPVSIGGTMQRALLAMLLVNANQVVSVDRLVAGLWEVPPERPTKAVQVYVSRLRKAFGGSTLVSKAHGYVAEVTEVQLDLLRFRGLRERARLDPLIAVEALREALSLWRGPALHEFIDAPFARGERARLEEERLEAVEERVDAELARGDHATLIGELEALVIEQPLRDRLRGQLMLALYRCGRQAEALQTYRTGRDLLVDQLGIEPSRALQQLEQAILLQDQRLDPVVEERPAEGSRGLFVGRKREIEALSEGVDGARAGTGSIFLLGGDPGIGKSWLADTVLTQARAKGVRVLVGRCWEGGGAPAFWPWIQALRPYIAGLEQETLREQLGPGASHLSSWFPELRERVPGLSQVSQPEGEGARFLLFDAAATFLMSATESQPIAIFIDDLHVADEPSLLLLLYLARSMASARLLILGAYRVNDPQVREPLLSTLSTLLREPVTHHLELGGLVEPEVAEYLEVATDGAVDLGTADAVYARTEGNPLFVAELVHLRELDTSSEWPAHAPVPRGVRDVIERRLRSLSATALRVLTLASVFGREFPVVALRLASDLPEDVATDALDETFRSHFVGEVPGAPGHLRFVHTLFRDTIYEGLSTPRRRQLHAQAGALLEKIYADRIDEHLSELAHHFAAAASLGDVRKAIVYTELAAERAVAMLAFEEAIRQYRIELDLIELDVHPRSRTRCDVLVALGDAQTRAGLMSDARAAFLEAAHLATSIGDEELLARSALGYGGRLLFARETDGDQLVSLLSQAEVALGEADSALRVLVLARHGNAVSQRLPESSELLTEEALAAARRLEDPATLAYAISARLYATRAPTKLDERWALTSELIESEDPERAFEGHAYRTIVQFARGDVPGIRSELAQMERLSIELAQPSQQWWVAATGTTLALLEGRHDDAEELMEVAHTLGGSSQSYDSSAFFQLQRFALRREQGRLRECVGDIEQATELDPSRPILRCMLAATLWELGEVETAEEALASAPDPPELLVNNDWLFSASLLAELLVSTDDVERIRRLYERLTPFDGLFVDTEEVSTGAVSRYLGLLAAADRHHDRAVHHFEEALAANKRIGARSWLARTQHDYALTLVARGGRGDRARADELVSCALATYEEFGIKPYRRQLASSSRER